MRLTAVRYDVESREPATCLQHAADLAVEPCPVGDVHRHMLQQHNVKPFIVKWKLQRAGGLERDLPALSGALGQIARGIHERLAEIDTRNPAAIGRSQKARRPADTRSDIQNRHVGGNPSQLGKLNGRREPSGVKLVEGSQLLRREPLFVRPEGRECRIQPLGQAARAIVVAHTIKDIGHCSIPLRLQILTADIRALPGNDYPR